MKKVEVIEDFLGLKKGWVLFLNEKTNKYEYITEDKEISVDSEKYTLESVGINKMVVDSYLDVYFRDISDEPIKYNYRPEWDWDLASYIKPRVVQVLDVDEDTVIVRNTDRGEVIIPRAMFNDLFKVIE
jgi:hypothetical protein